VHTLLDLRGTIPTFVYITDGKCHDSNILDVLIPIPEAKYLMDRAYVDFTALYSMHKAEAFFITRSKETLVYEDVELNHNIDERTGLRSDKTIKLMGPKSKQLYPEHLRIVDYYDAEKDMVFVFLTNNFETSALEIARL